MQTFSKRDATAEETERELMATFERWNRMNPNSPEMLEAWKARQAVAEAQGHKSEVCSCGVVFLAFHHFCRCAVKDCPISDGVSVLERMLE
jgi:hypothetical protein